MRSTASCRLRYCDRSTSTVTRIDLPSLPTRRSRSQSGIAQSANTSTASTLVLDRFACCPPGPPDATKRKEMSFSETCHLDDISGSDQINLRRQPRTASRAADSSRRYLSREMPRVRPIPPPSCSPPPAGRSNRHCSWHRSKEPGGAGQGHQNGGPDTQRWADRTPPTMDLPRDLIPESLSRTIALCTAPPPSVRIYNCDRACRHRNRDRDRDSQDLNERRILPAAFLRPNDLFTRVHNRTRMAAVLRDERLQVATAPSGEVQGRIVRLDD